MASTRWKKVALKRLRPVTAGLVPHRNPAWSPDGRRMAFIVGEGASATWVVTDSRGRLSRLLPGVAAGSAAFSPTGALAYGRRLGMSSELWLADGDTPPVRLLGGPGRLYGDPAWSPDGTLLAFSERSNDCSRLHLYDIESGRRVALPAEAGRDDRHPAFTPDGEVLFFDGQQGDWVAIYALERASGSVIRVTDYGISNRRPLPLDRDLLVVERDFSYPRAMTGLVLLDLLGGRERRLGERDLEAHEASCCRTPAGRVRVCFAAPPVEGAVHDVFQAALRGLDLSADAELEDFDVETEEQLDDDDFDEDEVVIEEMSLDDDAAALADLIADVNATAKLIAHETVPPIAPPLPAARPPLPPPPSGIDAESEAAWPIEALMVAEAPLFGSRMVDHTPIERERPQA